MLSRCMPFTVCTSVDPYSCMQYTVHLNRCFMQHALAVANVCKRSLESAYRTEASLNNLNASSKDAMNAMCAATEMSVCAIH
jgi:hypothetical protein